MCLETWVRYGTVVVEGETAVQFATAVVEIFETLIFFLKYLEKINARSLHLPHSIIARSSSCTHPFPSPKVRRSFGCSYIYRVKKGERHYLYCTPRVGLHTYTFLNEHQNFVPRV
jgi:hypothetical protein